MVRRWARDGRLERRAVIVGGGKNAEDLIMSLEAQADNDIRICGIFDDRKETARRRWWQAIPSLARLPNW